MDLNIDFKEEGIETFGKKSKKINTFDNLVTLIVVAGVIIVGLFIFN